MARNRTALCQLAEYYDEKDAIGLPFYEQGMWGYAVNSSADYGEVKQFLENYLVDEDAEHIDGVLEMIYDQGSCFTFGCVAGNAAAALGYEGRQKAVYGYASQVGFMEWDVVRPRGTKEEFKPVSGVAADALGLNWLEAEVMFEAHWRPKEGLSMGSVLRRLAGGAHLLFVSADKVTRNSYYRFLGDDDFPRRYVEAVIG